MPKDHYFASQCEGKEKMTPENARMIARKHRDPKIDAYKCPHCRQWHIGRNPTKGKPKR